MEGEAAAKVEAFLAYQAAFERLEHMLFGDLAFNGLSIRPLGVHCMQYGPSWVVKAHKHSFFEFHYVVKGRVGTTLCGAPYEVRAGQFYLMPPGTVHAHAQLEGESHIGFALRWELLTQGGSGKATLENTDWLACVSRTCLEIIADDGRVLAAILELLDAAQKGRPTLCLRLLLLKLIVESAAYYASAPCEKAPLAAASVMDERIAGEAVRFIEENYARQMDVKDVAASTYVSYSHLSRVFKAATGLSVSAYISKVRVLKAQYLLKCSAKPVGVVAQEVGFQSEAYFCDVFKKAVGTSPGTYRKCYCKLME